RSEGVAHMSDPSEILILINQSSPEGYFCCNPSLFISQPVKAPFFSCLRSRIEPRVFFQKPEIFSGMDGLDDSAAGAAANGREVARQSATTQFCRGFISLTPENLMSQGM
ncbi:MAG: hypothetical protein ACR2PX_17830, partial [Endozoicomonas sp.]|uniref:hypothetical protein n=1 Tax=Endozoicomonas sp. TaxID=1892382 RepID=UPI003D9B1739